MHTIVASRARTRTRWHGPRTARIDLTALDEVVYCSVHLFELDGKGIAIFTLRGRACTWYLVSNVLRAWDNISTDQILMAAEAAPMTPAAQAAAILAIRNMTFFSTTLVTLAS